MTIKVLDDNSTDGTRRKLEDLQVNDSRLQIIRGETLPKGWRGKTWAMHQLVNEATTKYVMFMDADVQFKSESINDLLLLILKNKTLYSLIPKQVSVNSWVQSFANFYLVWWPTSILPMRILQKRGLKKSAVSVGQILVGETGVFNGRNGIEKVKESMIEDVDIARNAMKRGYNFRNIYIPQAAVSNTYGSLKEAINGYSRSFYLINKDLPSFVFNILIPALLLSISILSLLGVLEWMNLIIVIINIGIYSLISDSSLLISILTYIPNLFLLIYTALTSYFKYHLGNYEWRGRVYEK